jgi:hypothetical protein
MARQRLSEAARFAALARLLDRRAPWAEVLNALARWPADQRPEQALATVEAALDMWPPPTRRLTGMVVAELLRGEVRPYLRLLRWLDLRLLWQARSRDQLFARMIAEGGVRELHALITRYDAGEGLISSIVQHITGLRHLYIGMSGVGSDGARALAEAPALAGLQHLSLHNNHIDDDGAGALIASPHLHGLGFLNLYGNRLSRGMVERVLAAPQWRWTRLVIHDQGAQWWK